MMQTICFRQKDTKKEYLAYYVHGTQEYAQSIADSINTNQPELLFNGELARCNEREYFTHEQEEMY